MSNIAEGKKFIDYCQVLIDKAKVDPSQLMSIMEELDGRSEEAPDPMYISPAERDAFVTQLADRLEVSPRELTALYRLYQVFSSRQGRHG